LLSLSSSDSRSVVGLSDSPLFEHSYSSLSQCVGSLDSTSTDLTDSESQILTKLQSLWMQYYPESEVYSFATDVSPITKPFSKKLAERQYVNIPNNVVPGNKSLSIGYKYSYVNLGYTPLQGGSRWSLPLSVDRVSLDSDDISTALVQISSLMTDDLLPFSKAKLVKNSADSGYFTARYLSPLVEEYPNMVQFCRTRHGNKVWQQAKPEERVEGQKGAPSIYGKQTYYLMATSDVKKNTNGNTKVETSKNRTAIYDLAPTETIEIQTLTSRGRAIIVKIERWDNMMVRSKKGYSMKDKPFNLFGSQVIDAETGELIFQKPMFIGVFGKLKDVIGTAEAHQEYRNRYDIEVHNRFSSQKLLLNDFQTPYVEHLDNWALIVATAYWLLFVAADEVDLILKPWERNLPKNKELINAQKSATQQPKKSVAQAKKGAFALFYTFDRKTFAPKSVNNGKGRKKGTKIEKKQDRKVNKKTNKSNFFNKTQKNE
jgi:hypothetical protein